MNETGRKKNSGKWEFTLKSKKWKKPQRSLGTWGLSDVSIEPGLSCDHVSTRPGMLHWNLWWGKKTKIWQQGLTWNLFRAEGSLKVFAEGSTSPRLSVMWGRCELPFPCTGQKKSSVRCCLKTLYLISVWPTVSWHFFVWLRCSWRKVTWKCHILEGWKIAAIINNWKLQHILIKIPTLVMKCGYLIIEK